MSTPEGFAWCKDYSRVNYRIFPALLYGFLRDRVFFFFFLDAVYLREKALIVAEITLFASLSMTSLE